jgi:hypothetical protein
LYNCAMLPIYPVFCWRFRIVRVKRLLIQSASELEVVLRVAMWKVESAWWFVIFSMYVYSVFVWHLGIAVIGASCCDCPAKLIN